MGAPAHSKLGIHIGQVTGYGEWAHAQFTGDLDVGISSSNEAQHFFFP